MALILSAVQVDSWAVLRNWVYSNSWLDLSYFVTGPASASAGRSVLARTRMVLFPSSRSPGPQTRWVASLTVLELFLENAQRTDIVCRIFPNLRIRGNGHADAPSF